jgi:homoserine kinase
MALTSGGLEVAAYADVPVDERNLVVRAARAAFDATGGQPDGLSVTYLPRIPHSRGLGSSAAAICAGIVAALALRAVRTERPDGLAFRLAAELEGHPDNVAACLLGGATIAWYDPAPGASSGAGSGTGRGRPVPRAVRIEPDGGLIPVAFIPQVRTSTEAARSALPSSVPHRDAAYTAGRAALLVAALTGRPDLLLEATEDRLHQDFRLPAVPSSRSVVTELRERGIPAVLSGSGPTVLALCRNEREADAAVAAGSEAAAAAGGAVDVLRPGLDGHGCSVVEG